MPKTWVSDARLEDLARGGTPLQEEIAGIAGELLLARRRDNEIERLQSAIDEAHEFARLGDEDSSLKILEANAKSRGDQHHD
jgi:hypothetical protein